MYVNIESYLYHFKFMVAHEIFHVLAKSLGLDEKSEEKLADLFAQILLFPNLKAKEAYEDLCDVANQVGQIKVCIEYAEKYGIHPYQVYKSADYYAENNNLPKLPKYGKIYIQLQRWVAKNGLVLDALFDNKPLNTISERQFLDILSDVFCTPIFDALKKYAADYSDGLRMVSTVLYMNQMDAIGLLNYWNTVDGTDKTTS